MENIKTIQFNGKDYKIKYALNDEEYLECISVITNSMINNNDDEDSLPFFISNQIIFDRAILTYYVDIDENYEDEFNEQGFKLIDIVKQNIYMTQYLNLINSIKEMSEFRMKSLFYQSRIDSKIEQLLDKIIEFNENLPSFMEKINKLLDSGEASKIIDFISPAIVKLLGKK